MIWGYRDFLGHKIVYEKTCYNSKIFMNFVDFSCVIFLAQNVSVTPCHILQIHAPYSIHIRHSCDVHPHGRNDSKLSHSICPEFNFSSHAFLI